MHFLQQYVFDDIVIRAQLIFNTKIAYHDVNGKVRTKLIEGEKTLTFFFCSRTEAPSSLVRCSKNALLLTLPITVEGSPSPTEVSTTSPTLMDTARKHPPPERRSSQIAHRHRTAQTRCNETICSKLVRIGWICWDYINVGTLNL
jgi:hypothetical protein